MSRNSLFVWWVFFVVVVVVCLFVFLFVRLFGGGCRFAVHHCGTFFPEIRILPSQYPIHSLIPTCWHNEDAY